MTAKPGFADPDRETSDRIREMLGLEARTKNNSPASSEQRTIQFEPKRSVKEDEELAYVMNGVFDRAHIVLLRHPDDPAKKPTSRGEILLEIYNQLEQGGHPVPVNYRGMSRNELWSHFTHELKPDVGLEVIKYFGIDFIGRIKIMNAEIKENARA